VGVGNNRIGKEQPCDWNNSMTVGCAASAAWAGETELAAASATAKTAAAGRAIVAIFMALPLQKQQWCR
jgi:hypothetical protein